MRRNCFDGLFVMMLLVVALLTLSNPASAAYFRFLNPLDEVKTGAFFKLGTPVQNVNLGFTTTLIKHRAEDGYLFVPGVSWSLLDVGAFKPADGGNPNAVLGPSIDLSEPVKLILRRGLERLQGGGKYASLDGLRAMLEPASAGRSNVALSIGPSLGVDPGALKDVRDIKGYALLHAGLSAKWGAP